jgi:hypothetical protein
MLPLTFATRNPELQKELIKIYKEGGLIFEKDEIKIPQDCKSLICFNSKLKSEEFKKIKTYLLGIKDSRGDTFPFAKFYVSPLDDNLRILKNDSSEIFNEFFEKHLDFFTDSELSDGDITDKISVMEVYDLFALYTYKFMFDLDKAKWDEAIKTLSLILDWETRLAIPSSQFNSCFRYLETCMAESVIPDKIITKTILLNQKRQEYCENKIKYDLFRLRIEDMLEFEMSRNSENRFTLIEDILDCFKWNEIVLSELNTVRLKNSIKENWDEFWYSHDEDELLMLTKIYRPVIDNCKEPFYELIKRKDWPNASILTAKNSRITCGACADIGNTFYPISLFRDVLLCKMRNVMLKIYIGAELSQQEMISNYVKISDNISTGAFFVHIPFPKNNPDFAKKIRMRIEEINNRQKE